MKKLNNIKMANKVKDFESWLSETDHVMDPKGYKPSVWQDRRVIRNLDGKEGKIAEPVGDANKGATKYRIVYDDGTDEVLSISAIRKHFEFYKES